MDGNEILTTAELLCKDDKFGKRELFQTAIQEYDESDDPFSLPEISQTPYKKQHHLPTIKRGVLRGIHFQPPNADALMRAYRFRVGFYSSFNSHSNTEKQTPSISLRRLDVRRIKRNQKRRVSFDLTTTGNRISNEHLSKRTQEDLDEECSDYDFDANTDDDEELPKLLMPVLHSQAVYRNICKTLGVVPSSRFFKSLTSQKCVMKHQTLLPKGIKACAIALMSNPCVSKLHFEDNQVGEGASFIAELLTENVSITDLTVSDNRIGSAGLKSICDVMKVNDKIKRLDLSGNDFREKDAEFIAEIIETNDVLQELILRHNCFGETGGVIIANSLGLTCSLKALNLSWNHLRRQGVSALADAMTVNCSIEVLDLSWNGFAIEGCKAMGKALTQNTSLRELDLNNGRINATSLPELLNGLKENTSLEIIRLGGNTLSIDSAVAILSVLKECPQLPIKELDIGDQCVDVRFMALLQQVRKNRSLVVRHGMINNTRDMSEDQTDMALDNEDPMMVLMECMRLKNLRLVDFFTNLDKDRSNSLECSEFRNGLLSMNVPISTNQIDKLIKRLDADGDGEVDFKELIIGQKEYKSKLHKMKQREKGVPYEETEIGRINSKLRVCMAFRQKIKAKSRAAAESQKEAVINNEVSKASKPAVQGRKSLPE